MVLDDQIHLAIAKFHEPVYVMGPDREAIVEALIKESCRFHYDEEKQCYWPDYANDGASILRVIVEAEIGIQRDGNYYVITGPQVSVPYMWQTKVIVPYRELRKGLIDCLFKMIPEKVMVEEVDDA